MKYITIVALLLIICNNLTGQITETKATQIAMEYIYNLKQTNYLVYRYPKPIDEKTIITTFDKSISLASFKSYVFFVDKQPLKNWAHLCSFLLVNKTTGKIEETEWKLPPNDLRDWEILTPITDQPVVKSLNLKSSNSMAATPICNPENCYAVIISGGYNSANNWQRYWNDCSAIYSSLVNVYNYLDDHIIVIMSDGTDTSTDRRISGGYDSSPLDLDGDGDNDIGFSATAANIRNVFNTLSTTLDSNDHLFIFVTDHGAQESGNDALMYLWGETFRDDEFATEVNKVTAKDISIVMEQCYSGGFVDDLAGQNRVIITACASNETSCGMGYYTYDEFVFDWIAAITDEDPNGNTVNADFNNDGFISLQEAFYYADTNDACTETPQYSSSPSALGTSLAIDGLIPYLSGPSTVCSPNTQFTVTNVAGATVTWTASGSIICNNTTGNPTTFSPNGQGAGTIQATVISGCGNITLPVKTVYVGKVEENKIVSSREGQSIGAWAQYHILCRTGSTIAVAGYDSDGDGEPMGDSGYPSSKSITSYEWSLPGGWSYSNAGGALPNQRIQITQNWGTTPQLGQTIQIGVRAQNDCGWTNWVYDNWQIVTCGSFSLLISPNPSTGESTISLRSENNDTAQLNTEWDLDVYDSFQGLKQKKTKIKTTETKINTSAWKDGVYVVRATIGDQVITEKMIVKH